MAPTPTWVDQLTPAGPPGSALLAAERAKSAIDVDQLGAFLFTKEALARQQKVLTILQSEPLFDKSANYFLGRQERIAASLAKAKRLQQLRTQHNWTRDEFRTATDLLAEPTPYTLHEGMFLPMLREQGTPAQHALFVEPAERYEIVGCYAQTELGHGSNVRGLETAATWDSSEKTFVLHSPTLTSAKWWAGSLGTMATHAVVMAQLLVGNKNHGPHPFVVPIRDMKTHDPLPGVHVGDVGPKVGYNTVDNGFLLLRNVKVPHENMLARFSRVDPTTGAYERPANPALVYGTLTYVRSHIVLQSAAALARGVTVAVRYCAVRRQFRDEEAAERTERMGTETQVLEYTMVQVRLLPLLAATFALHFTGRAMFRMYEANRARMQQQGATEDGLADLHATSCALKALSSSCAADGLETCRRACGGHGFSLFAGIGSWAADYLPNVTWEGDNYMLSQQVARYLLKAARGVLAPSGSQAPPGSQENDTTRLLAAYLARRDMGAAFDMLGSDAALVDAFGWRIAHLTFAALKQRDERGQTWNSLLVVFFRLSNALAEYLVVKTFLQALQDPATAAVLDPSTVEVLHALFRLFALHALEGAAGEFVASGAATVRQVELAKRAVMKLLGEIRPHAVRLVDAWKIPDWQLDSSLGRYDGRVYEDLFHRASELNPLNRVVFDPYPESGVLVKGGERGSKL